MPSVGGNARPRYAQHQGHSPSACAGGTCKSLSLRVTMAAVQGCLRAPAGRAPSSSSCADRLYPGGLDCLRRRVHQRGSGCRGERQDLGRPAALRLTRVGLLAVGLVPQQPGNIVDLALQRLQVAHDGIDVEATGLALQPQATVQELTHIHIPGPIVVDELEQTLCVASVQAKGVKKGLHAGVLEVLVDLLKPNSPRAVRVHFHEELAHFCGVLLLELHLLRDQEVPLGSRRLYSIVHEDTSDHVHYGQDREGHIEEEQTEREPADLPQSVSADPPAHAAQHGLHKAVDRVG
mmetsp:Transcript_144232/g.401931  ORF Transcript_144232/g.401931 Transcript_144232/m.401931 type:complete len:292 (+) Transcript_144232:77-952(+)